VALANLLSVVDLVSSLLMCVALTGHATGFSSRATFKVVAIRVAGFKSGVTSKVVALANFPSVADLVSALLLFLALTGRAAGFSPGETFIVVALVNLPPVADLVPLL
jgi:hypothetical protein